MTTPQQPENPYAATGGQPPQPPTYPQPGGYPAPGMPQAPAYQQGADPAYAAYAAGGYGGYGQPLPPLASWGKRVGASLIDAVPVIVIEIPMLIIALSTMETIGYDSYGNEVTGYSGAGAGAMAVGYILVFLFQLWNRWIRQGRTGQSIGKSAMHLRLVAEQTMQPIGPGKAFLRDLCHIADGIFYLGYLWPLWDAKRQTFADKIMTTVVVEG